MSKACDANILISSNSRIDRPFWDMRLTINNLTSTSSNFTSASIDLCQKNIFSKHRRCCLMIIIIIVIFSKPIPITLFITITLHHIKEADAFCRFCGCHRHHHHVSYQIHSHIHCQSLNCFSSYSPHHHSKTYW